MQTEVMSLEEREPLLEPDKEALVEQLMRMHGTELTNFAYTYVRDWGLAQEIVQDVFVRCYFNLDSFRGEASHKTWLFRITMNRCRDEMRKKSFQKLLTIPLSSFFSLTSNSPTPEDEFLEKSEQEKLAELVLRLPARYREVIILYYYSGFKTEEISRMMEVNAGTVRTRLRRARQLLQKKIEEVSRGER